MADTANYTHFDIDRYLNNRMTRQEMHDFEKAMMEDPFLADAFEGYSKSDHSLATLHLAEIEKSLTVKEEKAKIVAMASPKAAWWKVAAIILLIVGAGTIGYRLLDGSEGSMEIASTNKTMAVPVPESDTIKAEEEKAAVPVPQVFPAPVKEALAESKNTSPVIDDRSKSEMALAEVTASYDSSMLAASSQAGLMRRQQQAKQDQAEVMQASKSRAAESLLSGRVAGVQMAEQQREFKGKVLDPNGEPLAFATIHGKKDVGTVADANGNFKLKAPDSVLDVSVVVVGYGTTRAKLLSSKETNEVLVNEKAESGLSEMVVTTIGRKKRDSASFFSRNMAAEGSKGIEPVKGWQQFQQYIFENLQQIKDTSEAYTSGDVMLEFEVDTNGRPSKIKTIGSASEQNALKAIELLQKGPKWKRNKNNKGKVVVAF